MQFGLNHDRRNISVDDLLSDLRRVAFERSEQQVKAYLLKPWEICCYNNYSALWLMECCGWGGAGLETTIERNISNEKLSSALYDLWIALGRQPSYSEVQKPVCQFHVATYERRFGAWRQALEAFVSYANAEQIAAPMVVTASDIVPRQSSRCPDLLLRFKVLQRDRFRCCACGVSPSAMPGVVLEIDHIKPWSNGGETVIEIYKRCVLPATKGKQIPMKNTKPQGRLLQWMRQMCVPLS